MTSFSTTFGASKVSVKACDRAFPHGQAKLYCTRAAVSLNRPASALRSGRRSIKLRKSLGPWRLQRKSWEVRSTNDKSDNEEETTHEALSDLWNYATEYFLPEVEPLINDDSLEGQEKLLSLLKEFSSKLDHTKGIAEKNLSKISFERIYLTVASYITARMIQVVERFVRLTRELQESPSGEAEGAGSAAPEDLPERSAESSPLAKIPRQKAEVKPSPAPESANELFAACLGTTAICVVLGYSIVTALELAGLDTAPLVAAPGEPVAFAWQCLQWTVPAGVASHLFWRWAMFSDTIAGEFFREQSMDRADIFLDLNAFQISLLGALFEAGTALVFQGALLSGVTLFFAGVPSSGIDPYMFAAQPSLALQPHLPALWMWPFVAFGTGALQAAVTHQGMGGFREPSKAWIEEQCGLAIMKSLTSPTDGPMSGKELEALQAASEAERSSQEAQGAPEGSPGPQPPEPPVGGLRGQDAIHTFAQILPLPSMNLFLETFQRSLCLGPASQLYGPLADLVKSTLLSAETVLTGSVWTAVVTAAAINATESLARQAFLREAAESAQGLPDGALSEMR